MLSVLSACTAAVEVLNCNLPVIIAPNLYRCELGRIIFKVECYIMSVSTVNKENHFHSKFKDCFVINEKHFFLKETFS